jgi:elongation factor G
MMPLKRQTLSSIFEDSRPPGGIRVKAEAPLSAMFGYIGDLRTMTSGRGQFSMEFSHYAPCPKNVSDDVIAKAKARDEAARK